MSIYPNNNIIDRVYRSCQNINPSLVLDAGNGILKLVLASNNRFNFILTDNQKDLTTIYDLYNIDMYLVADYIQHSQDRDIYKRYHIKELLLLTDPPTPLLKREDLILLSERLDDIHKIIIGSDKINRTWSFLSKNEHIIPGIPPHEINRDNREKVCVLHNNAPSAQKICRILIQKYPELKTLSKFDTYHSVMEFLNNYRVCINLNSCIDSLYAMYAGCSVISGLQAYEHEKTYEDIDHILELVDQELSVFDIQSKINIHDTLERQYKYEIFADNISKLLSKYTKEPFYI